MSLFNGDCFEVMQGLADNSVDLVLTDPPYGLKFMGKKWDCDVPPVHVWYECLRVLKPGGHVLAFAGTRTQHRMACNIEDAGFEIRDMLAWVYGSGFPKSLDVSKAIDKAAGAEREVVRTAMTPHSTAGKGLSNELDERPWMTKARALGYHEHASGTPATDAAREWAGYGTALKPALEPITMARKPLVGTVAGNVMQYGTGALNIDACRVGTGEDKGIWPVTDRERGWSNQGHIGHVETQSTQGRWPANLLHDGSEEVLALFPMTNPSKSGGKAGAIGFHGGGTGADRGGHNDSGSAARFFYCAKASKRERDHGLDGMAVKAAGSLNMRTDSHSVRNGMDTAARSNHHPTVKPIALMEYLVQLASRPGAVVLDPFMGSGTTGIACRNLGREFIGIERDADYFEIAKRRIEHEAQQMELPA